MRRELTGAYFTLKLANSGRTSVGLHPVQILLAHQARTRAICLRSLPSRRSTRAANTTRSPSDPTPNGVVHRIDMTVAYLTRPDRPKA